MPAVFCVLFNTAGVILRCFFIQLKGGEENDNDWNYTADLASNGERFNLREKIRLKRRS